ncbi:MAG TPA: hypothetical protein VKM55_09865 [Candidatus Lokiarchaeia archaeon]|nr:hypothetical protein [Candidatus Lokiarchaeia archaeon]
MSKTTKPAKTAKPAPVAAASSGSGTTVELKKVEIQKKAYEISQAKKSYNDYVWLWAEADVKLGQSCQPDLKTNPASVKVDVKKIVAKPAEADVKKLAGDYFKKGAKVQDIHWFIAERQYILDAVKAKK